MNKSKAGWKQMTPVEYDRVKQLIALKLTERQVIELTGRSTGTIHNIKNSDSWEDYKQRTRKQLETLKKKYPTLEDKNKRPEQETTSLEAGRVQVVAEHQTATLERIAKAMERLADAWESSPKRKTLF